MERQSYHRYDENYPCFVLPIPGGLIVLSLRHGRTEAASAMHPVSADEIRRLAGDRGAFVERCVADEDHLGRPDLRWTRMAVRLPGRRS